VEASISETAYNTQALTTIHHPPKESSDDATVSSRLANLSCTSYPLPRGQYFCPIAYRTLDVTVDDILWVPREQDQPSPNNWFAQYEEKKTGQLKTSVYYPYLLNALEQHEMLGSGLRQLILKASIEDGVAPLFVTKSENPTQALRVALSTIDYKHFNVLQDESLQQLGTRIPTVDKAKIRQWKKQNRFVFINTHMGYFTTPVLMYANKPMTPERVKALQGLVHRAFLGTINETDLICKAAYMEKPLRVRVLKNLYQNGGKSLPAQWKQFPRVYGGVDKKQGTT